MRLAAFRELTRFEQTLFAIPFVLAGALLSAQLSPRAVYNWNWIWIIPAFLSARISGMAFNQLIDRRIDAENPRTVQRPLPAGKVSVKQARVVAWGALLLFISICLQINRLTSLLALVAACLLYCYSYMKRIHPSCHLVLGLIHSLGPMMAYAALTGAISPAASFLGAAAAMSIIGIDITYAIQDYEFDCRHRLFSIPVCFGVRRSILISIASHILCVVMLAGVGWSAHLPLLYYLVLPIVGGIFGFFHFAIRKHHQQQQASTWAGIDWLFFFCPVAVSTIVFLILALSMVWVVL